MENYCLAYGQIITPASLRTLAKLHWSKLKVQIRESSQYTNGEYLSLKTPDGGRISFEKIAVDEILVSGEAETADQLTAICQITSDCLTNSRLKHRLELHNAVDQQYNYLHYGWPLSS
ncbi:hypothetical protein [Hymenobacter guriensis]|uniref:DUF4288 domain-containing protein n=1 Tax=Hymenobacter guriensis TaxID=2793065 RepID=A0ABS0L5X9_9BACT|nr:hypothetical protein [Hymenobacter guriensis]MBG8554762.1 hypothetical protein [Hymenobacter guriensis]